MVLVDANKPLVRDPRDRWQLFRKDELGREECPYVRRWILDLGPLGSLRVHHWLGDDEQRALHDHPWGFLTIMLAGSYTDVSWPEWVKGVDWSRNVRILDQCRRSDILRPGSIRWRPAKWAHTVQTTGAWTILWTQPKSRSFGFYQENKATGLKWIKANKFFGRYGKPPCAP
jgi:hypothetical protein